MSIPEELSAAPVVPLRYLVSFNPRPTSDSGGNAVYLPMEAISEFGPPDTSRRRPFDDLRQGYSYVANGDVAFAKVTPCFENGKGIVARDLPDGQAFATTEVTVMRPSNKVKADYLGWILQSSPFLKLGESHMTGSGGLRRVPDSFVRSYSIPLPGRRTQQAIANFLDRETARIDTLIEEQQRLIEMLRERRHSLIDGVFDGHAPNARLQNACIDVVDCPHTTPEVSDDGEYEAVRTASVRNGKFRPGNGLPVDADTWKARNGTGAPTVGDVLFTREAPAGEACMVPNDRICLGQRMVLLRIDRTACVGTFLLWQIYSDRVQDYFRLSANGSTVANVRLPVLRTTPIWLPDLTEQHRIAAYLDEETAKIDNLIKETEQFIELSKERRSALITAAVTGQIDVRETT
ncbi:restriction endonuclease subunit S [Nocardia sp. NPDC059691]|uniref:restriction endonuclease subunit S n=1 Tax=Nocardia sp. NPDC059691 TaxID=3346908 RepID=UPI0036AD082D